MDAQIQGLQHQLDLLLKEKEEKIAEYDLEIQSWTTKEVELQAQVAKLDTSSSIQSPPPPHPSSTCAQPGL
eukprot:10464491-Karenia_brevis.AAC.1